MHLFFYGHCSEELTLTLPCKILVITPAHLAFDGLIRIYSQIQCALTDEIRWYIKDSGKCDLTAQFFLNRRHVNLDRTPDSGIYDAINIALVNSDSSHYLILGADDLVNNDALITALIRVKKHPDVLFHFYKTKLMPNDVITSYRNIPLRWSNASIMPSHSAGTIISRLAHDRYGEYSTDFRILGDAYFVLMPSIVGHLIADLMRFLAPLN